VARLAARENNFLILKTNGANGAGEDRGDASSCSISCTWRHSVACGALWCQRKTPCKPRFFFPNGCKRRTLCSETEQRRALMTQIFSRKKKFVDSRDGHAQRSGHARCCATGDVPK
jgi:hypothetical protein